MSEPLHDIDKFFYDNIEGHSEYPPKKVWDKIEAGLDKDTAVIYKKKYKSLKKAAAILLILFLGVLVYEIAGRRAGKENVAGVNKKIEQQGNATGTQNDNIPGGVRKNNDPSINTNKDNNTVKQDQPMDFQSEKTKVVKSNQPGVGVPGTADKSPGDQKRNLVISIPPLEKETSTVKNDQPGNSPVRRKQTIKSRPITKLPAENGLAFDITSPGKKDGEKTSVKSSANPDASSTNALANSQPEGTTVTHVRYPSFTLMSTGSWRKDMLVGGNPSFDIPENGSSSVLDKLNYPAVKKPGNPAFRNYGLSLSAYFSPNVAWNSLEDDEPHRPGNGPRIEDQHEIRRNEHNSFAYSGGLKLNYGLSKKVSLKAGINYTRSSSSVKPKDIYAEKDNNGDILYRFDCSSGYTYIAPHSGVTPTLGDSILATNSRNTLSYLGIPLEAEYRISFGKFSLSASVGGQLNILLEGKTMAILGKGTSDEITATAKTQGLSPTYFSAITSINGELQLNNRLSLIMAPTGQFGLSSINNGASVKTRPNYLGLAAGLKIKL